MPQAGAVGSPPPEFGADFLAWLREATERAWERVPEPTLSDFERAGVGGCRWRRGTRWTGGLPESGIRFAEQHYGIQFPSDLRVFLGVLHATTPPCCCAAFVDQSRMVEGEKRGFFDWRRDETEIRSAMAWPLERLLFDVENEVLWPASWGPRPETEAARRTRIEALVASAPPLVPVTGHRYALVGTPLILSVHQGDVIVYGRDLPRVLIERARRPDRSRA